MQNIVAKQVGNKVIIEIDATKRLGPSKSGKTLLVANSGGFASIEGSDGLKLSLNVCAPKA